MMLRSRLFWTMVLFSWFASAARSNDSIVVDVKHPGPVISPLLFGHNLEHTRHSVWQGLSAQLLANRKFAGPVSADGPDSRKVVRGEPSAPGVAAHWYGIGQPSVRFAIDQTTVYAGRQSERISVAGSARGGLGQRGIPLQQGKDYELGLWMKTDRELGIIARIVDDSGKQLYAEQAFGLAPGAWQNRTCTLKAPRTDQSARLEVLFDGPGSLWLGASTLLPGDHFHGLRRDVVALLKEMSVPLLRWPGGNFTRDYRWQDGLLPVDQRPPIATSWHETQPFADNLDAHEIGTDEFLALCRELGAEPAITLNLARRMTSPDDAAAWVEFCNGPAKSKWGKVRAERGHPEPYRVRYWSLGNEVWGGWMGQVHCDPKTYAQRVALYGAAMKKVDPSIILIASGLRGEWDADLLAHGAEQFNLISEHDYAPEGKSHGARPEQSELARLATVPSTSVLTMLRIARQSADRLPQGRHLEIAFDEWNVWHDWFIRPFDHAWNVGPIDGIYAATMLNLLCREAGPLKLTMAAFFEPVNEGAIDVQPGSARLTTVGQVFSLFRALHGNRLLTVRTGAHPASPDVCGSLDRDGRSAVLMVANHDAAGPRQIVISLEGAQAIACATARILSAGDLQANVPFEDRMEHPVIDRGAVSLKLPRFGIALVRLELP